ncbi:MAG TPA: hypothetical protein VMM76_05495 [Pirellulaceae bacterium]|nr:hypothetical protein [Pirellulaceae bacterium]
MHKLLAVATLFLLGVLLAVANVWFAAARSTIPLRLDGKVVAKRQLSEKHPGTDDVYLLELNQQGRVQVDKHVFDAVKEEERIRKESWSRHLEHDGHATDLEWSTDLLGMLWTMPGSLIVMLVTLAAASMKR